VSAIGRRVRRGDGEAKVRGAAIYGMDYAEPGMLPSAVRRADLAAARISRVDTTAASAMPGVRAVVTAADAPVLSGKLGLKDQTMFAAGYVRYAGEPIAAVAADTPEQAAAAAAAIEIELEPLEPVLDLSTALDEGTRLVHPEWADYEAVMPGHRHGNLAWEARIDHGDVDAAFAAAYAVVADEFRVPRQHQSPIEPHVAVARFELGRFIVHTPTQHPYLVQARVAELLRVPPSAVRVIVPTVGGGFGGKIDCMLEPIACLLARISGRPVRVVNDRADELATTGPRENALIRLRTAVDAGGRILAQEGHIIADNGANSSGETVACACVAPLTLGGTYAIPAARYRSQVVYTNTAPTAAFRGIGGVYSVFAQELHLDHIARGLDIDRREFRLRNVLRAGDEMVNGQVMADAFLVEALESIERRAPWAELKAHSRPLRGVAVVPVTWITNPGPSDVTVRLAEDGNVVLTCAGVEIGTGSVAVGIRQVVAEQLGVPVDDVLVVTTDTDGAGYDHGTQGSRTVYGLGSAAIDAAAKVKAQILATAAAMLEAAEADLELVDARVGVIGDPRGSVSLASVAARSLWSTGPISATGRFVGRPVPFDQSRLAGALFTYFNAASYHAHLAEVEVDPDTGRVRVLRYLVAQDVGKAINPTMIEGQVQGGVAQGIGYALFEELRLGPDGLVQDTDLEHYRLPTALDVPSIDLEILENPCASGPFGAKGAGEAPIVPVAAVIACAVADAIGRPINELPISPARVLAALREPAALAGTQSYDPAVL
jgi:CO/xanthine dehydrogenase Mo-binding subunit